MSHNVSAVSARPLRSALRASAAGRLAIALAAAAALWALAGWALGWWGPA
ncbi:MULTISPECIES: hypothetical protein [Bordetella]|uniref:Uncharacterized protein n=1 Tax=Bordetella petrii TaxID=94624 RepID=A0ABT7W149_9BORD|nr:MULTISPECIES: hypothetical protein [Bordetella]MDM9558909.1 hypothetical protein [Bordetella petrii]